MLAGLLLACGGFCLSYPAAAAQSPAATSDQKIIGMYIYQHWPYLHPYTAHLDGYDYRGHASGLEQLGFNTLMIWPLLEISRWPTAGCSIASGLASN